MEVPLRKIEIQTETACHDLFSLLLVCMAITRYEIHFERVLWIFLGISPAPVTLPVFKATMEVLLARKCTLTDQYGTAAIPCNPRPWLKTSTPSRWSGQSLCNPATAMRLAPPARIRTIGWRWRELEQRCLFRMVPPKWGLWQTYIIFPPQVVNYIHWRIWKYFPPWFSTT